MYDMTLSIEHPRWLTIRNFKDLYFINKETFLLEKAIVKYTKVTERVDNGFFLLTVRNFMRVKYDNNGNPTMIIQNDGENGNPNDFSWKTIQWDGDRIAEYKGSRGNWYDNQLFNKSDCPFDVGFRLPLMGMKTAKGLPSDG